MTSLRYFASCLLLAFWVGPILAVQEQTSLQVIQSSPSELHLRFAAERQSLTSYVAAKTKEGAFDSLMQAPNSDMGFHYLILLPPEGHPKISANPTKQFLLPLSGNHFNSTYSMVTIQDSGWWRGFHLARLVIRPIMQGPDNAILLAEELDIRIDFSQTPNNPGKTEILPEERQVLKKVLNREMAPFWRRQNGKTEHRLPKTLSPSPAPSVKILVKSTGMYRVDFQSLQQAGFRVSQVAPQSLHLFNRGNEIPIFFFGDKDSLFEAGEALWFWGNRLRGADGWFDDEAEYNVYWLTQSETPALRFRQRQVRDDPGVPIAKYFYEKLHFEEDHSYYHGDDEADIFTTAKIPGEGWVWERLLDGESLVTNRVLPHLNQIAPDGSLRVRIRGITKSSIKPNHHVQILLNNQLVADTLFSDNDEILLETAFPSQILRQGNNEFKILSVGDTGASIDQIYLDWLELGFWRSYIAEHGQLVFKPPEDSTANRIRYRIGNLTENDIYLFDITRGEVLQGFVRTGLDSGQFAINFVDSVKKARKYVLVTPTGLLKPAAVILDTPSSWRRPEHGADYIIITHPDFIQAAEKLASFREKENGFRTAIVQIQDIYDEFHFGMPSALAIRDFLTYSYHHWQPPRPRYVVLMGDGTWDPKHNSSLSTKQNFIPVYGNPVSDSRLASVDGPDDFLPDMYIGRIPVETAEQAAAVVDKIIQYESQPLQDWGKDFVFLNGGINSTERNLFLRQSEKLIQKYVETAPVKGRAIRLYKTSEGRRIGELLPEILAALDSGAVMFTFSGHAGSQTWELMMQNDDIPKLANLDRLPFIASMTCHTARFANPEQNSFGEDFLRLPARGAVAFWGTSGWGFIFQDGLLLDGLYASIAEDSIRSIGAAIALAKLHLWQENGTTQTNINIIDQYTLLGDPALNLALPLKPDLALTPSQIRFTPPIPSEDDSLVQIRIAVRNRGLVPADSTQLSLQAMSPNPAGIIFRTNKQLGPVGYSDTVSIAWAGVGRRGEMTIQATVDPQNKIDEVDETNNRAQKSVYFQVSSLTTAFPAPLQVVPESQPVLSVYNPDILAKSPRHYFFEIDTSEDFNSPFKIASPAINEQPVRTSWQVPGPLQNGAYFWRSRSEERGIFRPWQISSFFVEDSLQTPAFLQTGRFWKKGQGQFALYKQGVGLPSDTTRWLFLQVKSGGQYDKNYCELIVNGEVVNQSARGLNILAIDPVSQQMIAPPKAFDSYASQAASDSMATFLASLPARTILLAGIRGDGSQNMTDRAYQALEAFGSRLIRQVKLYDSWAMIGSKGFSPGEAQESSQVSGAGPAIVSETLQPFALTGEMVSPVIGPARAWRALSYQALQIYQLARPPADPGTHLSIEIQGRQQARETWNVLFPDVEQKILDLQQVDPQQYPYLRLVARFSDDDGLDSPALQAWQVEYQPTGDLVLPAVFVSMAEDSLLPGETFQISAEVFYFGQGKLDSVVVRLADSEADNDARNIVEKIISIEADAARKVQFQWAGSTPGTYNLRLEVDPHNTIAESNELNNAVPIPIHIRRDDSSPELAITFDGMEIANDEFVSSTPMIVCRIFADSPLAIRDSSNISIFIDDHRLWFSDALRGLQFRKLEQGRLRAEVLLKPDLPPGEHVFSFVLHDQFGHVVREEISAKVSENLQILDLMNYPNPFANQTSFTFKLTLPSDEAMIKIYTLAGRLIRTIQFFPKVGFNQILWDGRDADGDFLANGVYLYKLIAGQGQKQVEQVEKFVIAR